MSNASIETKTASTPGIGRRGAFQRAIIRHIAEMRPGDRLPSIRKLMDTYGVTQVTVERCLGYLEGRGKIVRKARRGTYVAETTARGENHAADKTLGVIVPCFTLELGIGRFLEGLEEAAAADGWMVQICNAARGQEHELQFFRRCAEIGTQALVVYASSWNILTAEYCDEVRRFVWNKQLSVVGVDLAIPGVGCDLVAGDDTEAYERATKMLLERRARRICYLEAAAGLVSAKRFAGVQKAIEAQADGAVIVNLAAPTDRSSGTDPNVETTAQRIAAEMPADVDAVIVGSTPLLASVLRAAELRGRNIGEDLAVVASLSDNAPACQSPIIELRKPNRKIGRKAFKLVMRRLNNSNVAPVECRVPFEIINPYKESVEDRMGLTKQELLPVGVRQESNVV